MQVTVGVDVGGTNTDAAVVSGHRILGHAKHFTTADITSGVIQAITQALNHAAAAAEGESLSVEQVHIGTTHFVNAVVQRKDLVRVSVLRLCGPATTALPPFSYFPEALRRVIQGTVHLVDGGYEFDGITEIRAVNPAQITNVLQQVRGAGVTNLVISGVFSPVTIQQELKVAELIRSAWPDVSLTLSHQIGQLGLLERENACILNETIRPLCQTTVKAFRNALDSLGLTCPFYLTQNDGTLLSASQALEVPVYTFASGPTNSMRGAAFLSGIKEGIVVDIGGTTTDVGILHGGFPREASSKVKIAEVQTNFRMPDVLSIGLGGGSIVTPLQTEHKLRVQIGPQSVGYQLQEKALIFGGSVLTASDVAVAASLVQFGDPSRVASADKQLIEAALLEIRNKLAAAIDQVKISKDEVPVILVGGGSVLIDCSQPMKGCNDFIKPQHFEVANAVGAALSQVSGNVDYVVSLADRDRNDAIHKAKHRATQAALQAGASPHTIKISDIQEVPLAYLPGNATRVKVKAVGDLQQGSQTLQVIWSPDLAAKVISALPKSTTGLRQTHGVTGQDLTGEYGGGELAYPETEPLIDEATGEWCLSHWDIECIAVGAGILGCGGGGSPNTGRLRAHRELLQGNKIRIVTPERLHKTLAGSSGRECVVSVAQMGAPTIGSERIQAQYNSTNAIKYLLDLYNISLYDEESTTILNTDGQVIEETEGVTFIRHYDVKDNGSDKSRCNLVAVTSAEIGGSNGIEPLVVGAQLGLPVLDVDFMGRAFPELQMSTNCIYGIPPHPAVIANYNDWRAVALKVDTPKHLENLFRDICIQMGCGAAFVQRPISVGEVLSTGVLHSQSRAWRLGRAVLHARRLTLSPTDAILEHEGGKLLLTGKIVDVERRTTGGFAKGKLLVEGFAEFASQFLAVDFQNENLIANRVDGDTVQMLACTPDLITVVDADTGEPISTELVRYGLRVAVIAIPAPPRLTTDKALAVLGPQAFGYLKHEATYTPCTQYVPHGPVPPV